MLLMLPTFLVGYAVALTRLIVSGFVAGYKLAKNHIKDYDI